MELNTTPTNPPSQFKTSSNHDARFLVRRQSANLRKHRAKASFSLLTDARIADGVKDAKLDDAARTELLSNVSVKIDRIESATSHGRRRQ
jgi:hypothetical protein